MGNRMRVYQGVMSGQSKFKDDLEMIAREKLKELGDFPVYITPALKERIKDLQDEFLELRKRKQFTTDKGVAILKEIDIINKDLITEAKHQNEEEEEEEYRKRKLSKPKPKRKIVRKRK